MGKHSSPQTTPRSRYCAQFSANITYTVSLASSYCHQHTSQDRTFRENGKTPSHGASYTFMACHESVSSRSCLKNSVHTARTPPQSPSWTALAIPGTPAGPVLPLEPGLSCSLMNVSGDKGSWSSSCRALLWRQRQELMYSLFFCTKKKLASIKWAGWSEALGGSRT